MSEFCASDILSVFCASMVQRQHRWLPRRRPNNGSFLGVPCSAIRYLALVLDRLKVEKKADVVTSVYEVTDDDGMS